MPHYGSIVWETVGRRVEISAKVGATARSTSLVAESERNRKSEKGREREEGFNFSQRGRVARDYGHLQKGRRRRQRGWKQRNRFFVSRVWRPPPPPPILYPYTSPTPFNAFTTFPIEIKRSPRSRVGWCKMKDDGGGREVWQKRRGRG